MSVVVTLPQLGESVVEGTIARWLVKEGDRVELDQPLVEVTTDKVDAEIPAPEAGVIEAILAPEGATVEVGAELARIATGGAAAVAAKAAAPARSAAPAQPAAAARPAAPRATPTARRAAEESGVDLARVEATGPGGRVRRLDVERAGGGAKSAAPAAASAKPARAPARSRDDADARARFGHYAIQEGDRVIPMSPLRKLVAEHMVYSKRTSPHVGTVAEVDLGGVAAVRDQHKRAFQAAHGLPLTYLPFVVHATVRALREFTALNASVLEDAIVEKRDIHIGVAVETDKGLVVPVLRHADRLSLAGLAAAIEDLSNRARTKKLTADDLKGGTFTVSNPGRQGNLYGFAIINQPQVGILRMGEIVKRPVVRDLAGEDAIVIRPDDASGALLRPPRGGRRTRQRLPAPREGAARGSRVRSVSEHFEVDWLGSVRYGEALERQLGALEERRRGGPDRLLLLEHPPVITLGRSARRENLRSEPAALAARGVELFEVARGGDVTWHGPGQLVGYLIADLAARGAPDVGAWLRRIEAALIEALGALGLEARAIPGLTGVFLATTERAARRGRSRRSAWGSAAGSAGTASR